jgi:hypothetical protein
MWRTCGVTLGMPIQTYPCVHEHTRYIVVRIEVSMGDLASSSQDLNQKDDGCTVF